MIVNYQYDGVNFAKANVSAVTFDDVVIIHFGKFPESTRRIVLDRKKLSGMNVIEKGEVK